MRDKKWRGMVQTLRSKARALMRAISDLDPGDVGVHAARTSSSLGLESDEAVLSPASAPGVLDDEVGVLRDSGDLSGNLNLLLPAALEFHGELMGEPAARGLHAVEELLHAAHGLFLNDSLVDGVSGGGSHIADECDGVVDTGVLAGNRVDDTRLVGIETTLSG